MYELNQPQVPAFNTPEFSFLTHDAPWTHLVKVMLSIHSTHIAKT